MTSIFVAKLDFGMDNQQLKALFEKHGNVLKASIAMDKETGKSRGFGFVEMSDVQEAQNAISALDGFEISGRPIAVKQAEDRGGQKKPFNNLPRDGQFKPRENSSPRPDFRSSEAPSAPVVPFTSDSDHPSKEARSKKEKDLKKKEKPKTHKMEAYKKSGKNNRFFEEEDDDEDLPPLFGYPDEDDDDDEED
jgi:RNA recognition motif-containing protein